MRPDAKRLGKYPRRARSSTARARAVRAAAEMVPGSGTGLRRRGAQPTGAAPGETDSQPSGGGGWYEVCIGDTAASVAMRHGLRQGQLIKLNQLLTPNLYPGQRLRVPQLPDEARAQAPATEPPAGSAAVRADGRAAASEPQDRSAARAQGGRE